MPLHMLSNIEYLDARRAVASFRNIVTARKTCTSGFEGGGEVSLRLRDIANKSIAPPLPPKNQNFLKVMKGDVEKPPALFHGRTNYFILFYRNSKKIIIEKAEQIPTNILL